MILLMTTNDGIAAGMIILALIFVFGSIFEKGFPKRRKPLLRSVPPVDLGGAFEKMKAGMRTFTTSPGAITYSLRNGKMYSNGQELVPMDRVKALTNSAFIAGTTVYEAAEERWTYQEWEKENLP